MKLEDVEGRSRQAFPPEPCTAMIYTGTGWKGDESTVIDGRELTGRRLYCRLAVEGKRARSG